MQTPLQKFTNQIYQKLESMQLTLEQMSLKDIKVYQCGLSMYKRDIVDHLDVVGKEIKRKEAKKRKEPTTGEKAANWWAAMGIIFLCLIRIITGGACSINQIQQIQTKWLKWLFICVVLGVGLLMFVFTCKWIWPRRNINQFERLFEKKEE